MVSPDSESPRGQLAIAVVGAGLLGRLLSWRLLRQGHRITLLEAGDLDHPRAAAHTAAAMISPLSEVVSAEPLIYHMGLESLQLWPRWLETLNRSAASPIQYSATGSIVVAHPQDAAELQQFRQDLHYKLTAGDTSQWLSSAELRSREPQLAHFPEGLYLPQEAHLDNRRLLQELLREIRKLGARCEQHCPAHLENGELIAAGYNSDTFDWIIDCRGMGRKEAEPELRGVRGEVMWVQTREFSLNHAVRLMHPRYKLYVVPKPDHRFIIGATEIESEDRSAISLQSTLELASALYTINPMLAEARVIETDTNLRPAYRDNLPRIRATGKCLSINGLYRHGYLLAPTIVEHTTRYIEAGEQGPFWADLAGERQPFRGEINA
ncbi:glycine oxidase ThiO [Gilvimarinus sp. F26214L]|uniref:glycine oxidase ThiO n=1 Tax=Gilvimarinus sp. DZF01 TaxID=3461371 RepID=UPI0040452C2A